MAKLTPLLCCSMVLTMVFSVAYGQPRGDRSDENLSHRIPDLKTVKFELPNGLDVIIHEDHSVPIVCVNIWYHVGSKNEKPGKTGFAHLFEHLMFQGSKHHNDDYFKPLQAVGGTLNGSTSSDRTNYWEVVPSNCLELALWLESDRMGYLLPALSRERFENQREVVKNERRQRYENQPYGLAAEVLSAAMYPPNHPYHWPVIGSMRDLEAASREDAVGFFLTYYHPGNASLCIAGDVELEEAKQLVTKYFGALPSGPTIPRFGVWVPELKESCRVVMEDRVTVPRLYLAWHTVPYFAPDDAALDLLAMILTSTKSARLYRTLVRDLQIAQDVTASQESREIAGRFLVVATAQPGRTVEELERAIDAELKRFQEEGPTPEELQRAVSIFEARFVRSFEAVGGFGGKADQLNAYNVLLGDPQAYRRDFLRYLEVTPKDIQRVAQRYLSQPRVSLAVLPGPERTEPKYLAGEPPREATPPPGAIPELPQANLQRPEVGSFDRSRPPEPGPTPSFRLPAFHRFTLSNGLKVLLVEHTELPVFDLSLLVEGGSAEDPPSRLGLSAALAAVLDEGTKKRTALQIAEELAGIGASLSVSAGANFLTLRLAAIKHRAQEALDIFADVLRNPSFPPEELERQRTLALGHLARLRDHPTALAALAFPQLLYGPDHPYGRPNGGTLSSWRAFSREDLVELYQRRFRPEKSTLILVGDLTPEEGQRLLEQFLGDWSSTGPAEQLAAVDATDPEKPFVAVVERPGAAQSILRVGQLAPPRQTPDYYALVVLNTVFGGEFTSRLNMKLREEKGYTYGARSAFEWQRGRGIFSATTSVATDVTGPALQELLAELRRLREDPPREQEVQYAKSFIIRSYPSRFETTGDIAARLETLVEFNLPDDYYNTFIPRVEAVTVEEVRSAVARHIHPDRMISLVVGDPSQIVGAVQEAVGNLPVQLYQVDEEFRLVPVRRIEGAHTGAAASGR
jgi:zinc protease